MEENVKLIPGERKNLINKNDTLTKKPSKVIETKTSLTTLILWNVKKVMETNPSIDIKNAIKEVQRRLEAESCDVSFIIPEYPEERHLACALLAWQQLGHSDADSLCRFVEEEQKSRETESIPEPSIEQDKSFEKSFSLESYNGPVVKLPIEPKIVMRMDKACCKGPASGNKGTKEKEILNKIEAACCKIDSGCADQLTDMDDTLKDLRKRAAMLGRREAERVELLERAEAAWRDLERGYKRRLNLAEEKEDELSKQLQKLIDERNNNKNNCLALTQQLKIKGEIADRDRQRLAEIEKDLCERACTRQRLLEESARLDALLTDHQCKVTQLERDLTFKEEQSRRKKVNIESELDAARALTHEAERAMRAELSGLRDQVIELSKQLTAEDAENARIQEMLTSMREEKMEMIEDLEGCKELCDGRMQEITDEIVAKQTELAALKEKVLECRCKLPQDVNIEVKRTPSLAALCNCTPDQKLYEPCSCTSLRGRLLNNLLSDLFSGLQSELGPSGAEMPCQLLKCLEDKHNWDRASIVKSNLKNFFAQLLMGELDIAIANSIERYHPKWIGETCADTVSKITPDPDISRYEEGWQQRVIEKRAQKLATELAQQLFQEKAEELTKQARDLIDSGPPPCECHKEPQKILCKGPPKSPNCSKKSCNSCYTCLVPMGLPKPELSSKSPPPWTQALQDVTQLRLQIEDLKKESIKKGDLKEMELKIAKIVERASFSENKDTEANFDDVMRNLNTDKFISASLSPTLCKSVSTKKKQTDGCNSIKKVTKANSKFSTPFDNEKTLKSQKKFGQTYAINTCLCSPKDNNKINHRKAQCLQNEGMRTSSKLRNSKDLCLVNSVKISKPISASLLSEDLMSASTNSNRKMSRENICPNVCFHKVPSNTSIDKLLETLTKWKHVLSYPTGEEIIDERSCPCPANKKSHRGSVLSVLNKRQLSISKQETLKDHLNKSSMLQKSSQHKLKQSVLPERENRGVLKKDELIEEVKFHISQISKIMDCKSPTKLRKSKPNSEAESHAKIDNIKAHRSFNKPATTVAVAENKYNTRSYIDRKVPFNGDTVLSNAKTLEKIIVNDEVQFNIPTTESVYIGAVNLDKSNEEVCSNNLNENKYLTKPINVSLISPEKCIVSSKCSCDKVLMSELPQNGTKHDKSLSEFMADLKSQPIKSNEDKAEKILPCDYNCNIKFLGVTLTDVKPKEKLQPIKLPQDNQANLKTELKENDGEHTIKKLNSEEREKYKSIEDNVICGETIKQSKTNQNEQQEIIKTKTHSCECNTKFDKFKNCIDIALQYESSNNDKSLDVQSFIDTEDNKESCICCDHSGDEEESKDLEKNAFQLLEEHLKQKLEEFKESSYKSSGLPPYEEEKLFSTILKRVKKIISDSTNNISCKCFVKDGEGHGSWNRAYALLQEYLRIKIKRVQCTCSFEEDNREKVLPDVLNKVCNLIDSDFQRLKDVCGSQIGKEPQKSKVQEDNSKQKHFKYETPEKDTNTDLCLVIDKPYFILEGKQIIRENVLLQVSNCLGMDTKSCDPIGFSKTDNLLDVQEDILTAETLKCSPVCNDSQKHADSEILHTKKNVTYNFPYLNGDKRKFKAASDTYTKFDNDFKHFKTHNGSNKADLTELGIDFLYDSNKCTTNTHDSDVEHNNEKVMSRSDVDTSPNTKDVIENILKPKNVGNCESCPQQDFPNCHISYKDSTQRLRTSFKENTESHPKAPYLGYTISCSCDPALGKCVCTKSIFKPSDEINKILNKSLETKYDDKVSYIMKNFDKKLKGESENLGSINNLMMDSYHVPFGYKHDCETDMSNIGEDEVILRDSTSNFHMANMMTNTYDDNNSVVTDNSNNEGSVDWCDCCTNEKYEVQNQLKKSIFFPVPIENPDEKYNKSQVRFSNSVSKQIKPCNCDMVPICHVKLLVENIESNLANSKCTCDSMISKVCPVHSHQ